MSLVQLSTLLPFSNGKLSKAGYMEFHDKLIAILQPKAAAEQVESIQEVCGQARSSPRHAACFHSPMWLHCRSETGVLTPLANLSCPTSGFHDPCLSWLTFGPRLSSLQSEHTHTACAAMPPSLSFDKLVLLWHKLFVPSFGCCPLLPVNKSNVCAHHAQVPCLHQHVEVSACPNACIM